MRALSLFSGAGGADLGLHAAGIEVVGLCENAAHARAVLRHRFPEIPLHDDVATLDGTQYRGVELVIGGSPCQDMSVAGKRGGLAGARSGLFYHQVRIWNETEAPYLIWENVAGALSSPKREVGQPGADFAAVLSAVVGRAIAVPRSGWTRGGVATGPAAVAAWYVFNLEHFGVPQSRDRIALVASRAGGVDPAEVLALRQGVRGDSPPRFETRERATALAQGGAGAGGRGGGCAVNISDAQARLSDVTGNLSARETGGGFGGGAQMIAVLDRQTDRQTDSSSARGLDADEAVFRAERPGRCDGAGAVEAVAGCLQERDAKGADSDTKPGHLIVQPRA